ncbi:MAG: HTH-type transcriptional repressor CarH [Verrucomicrobiae bacterium]|nr:HTH-type transcriptional repressor CarH [Verrucomicrobiae bacterium]
MSLGKHPIKVVTRRTGLSPHVIRVWERRYRAVNPERSGTNRRLYSDEEIERLGLLRRLTESGHAISQIAALPGVDLEKLLATDSKSRVISAAPLAARPVSATTVAKPLDAIHACLSAVEQLDATELDALLHQAAITHSQPVLLEKILVPLMTIIGDRWRDGSLRPVHEHLASVVVRNFLTSVGGAYAPHEAAPRLIVTTPVGQLHEIGALLVTASAAAEGWQVIYLGPNLPAEEIAAATAQHQARAVALSVVYPADDPRVEQELLKLRRFLPEQTLLLVGGRAAGGYRQAVTAAGGILIEDLTGLRRQLQRGNS